MPATAKSEISSCGNDRKIGGEWLLQRQLLLDRRGMLERGKQIQIANNSRKIRGESLCQWRHDT
jgi:hypothetical protein